MELELKVYDGDLKPKFRHLNPSATKYEHFTAKVQKVIRYVGRATYWSPHGIYNAIYPPKKKVS